ncbi:MULTISPECIES: 5-formyltetrahydrofolate cyclo-ligase [Exiguobacterium]|uniref:5-formyltetrahydrofolate cyclo-ligase n=1 Tax=Exiguobacterium TaxID=33986 RepID=UPI001BE5C9C4|nr:MULTISPECIES: 5-formyltetrahydrofolate cyclo-ligase [Exiguobacterium]MCT4792581.1 5-formyltetrahydrofolate cyclo-ligase [Exiguobacterium artemiae]
MEKQEIRRWITDQLNRLENREQKQQQIYDQLFELPEWKNAQSIAVTLSFRNECATDPIVLKAWQLGKQVVIPKVIQQEMKFFEYVPNSPLIETKMGIREPDDQANEQSLRSVDLCLVPGRAFTRAGYRIGWGGGFYDRALTDYPGHTVAVTFDCQLVSDFEVEPFDQPVQKIVTESKVIVCR